MKFLSLALLLSVISFLLSCNEKEIEVKRQGLIPERANVISTFGYEDIQKETQRPRGNQH